MKDPNFHCRSPQSGNEGFTGLPQLPEVTTGLDLLDLSEPVSQTQTKVKRLEASSKTSSLKKKADGSDLIGADAEQRGQPSRGPETSSLDLGEAVASVRYCSPLP